MTLNYCTPTHTSEMTLNYNSIVRFKMTLNFTDASTLYVLLCSLSATDTTIIYHSMACYVRNDGKLDQENLPMARYKLATIHAANLTISST